MTPEHQIIYKILLKDENFTGNINKIVGALKGLDQSVIATTSVNGVFTSSVDENIKALEYQKIQIQRNNAAEREKIQTTQAHIHGLKIQIAEINNTISIQKQEKAAIEGSSIASKLKRGEIQENINALKTQKLAISANINELSNNKLAITGNANAIMSQNRAIQSNINELKLQRVETEKVVVVNKDYSNSLLEIGANLATIGQTIASSGVNQIKEPFEEGYQSVQNFAKGLGVVAIGMTATNAVIANNLVKSYSGLNEEMANVNSVLLQSPENFKRLNSDVRDLSIGLKLATETQIAKGLYDVGSAGFAAGDGITVLNTSIRASKAGRADLKDTSSLIAKSLNGMGLAANQADYAANVLFTTVGRGVLEFKDLTQGAGQLFTKLKTLEQPMEVMGSALSIGTRKGLTPQAAITDFNSLLVAYSAQSEESKKKSKELGIEIDANAVRMRGFGAVTATMIEAAKKTGDFEGTLMTLLGRQEAMDMALLLSNADEFKAEMTTFKNTTTAFSDALAEQEKSLTERFNKITVGLEAIKTEAGGLVGEFAANILPVINNVIDDFNNLSEAVRKAILIFFGIVAMLPAVILAFGATVLGIGIFIAHLVIVKTAISLLIANGLAPLVLIIKNLAGVIARATIALYELASGTTVGAGALATLRTTMMASIVTVGAYVAVLASAAIAVGYLTNEYIKLNHAQEEQRRNEQRNIDSRDDSKKSLQGLLNKQASGKKLTSSELFQKAKNIREMAINVSPVKDIEDTYNDKKASLTVSKFAGRSVVKTIDDSNPEEFKKFKQLEKDYLEFKATGIDKIKIASEKAHKDRVKALMDESNALIKQAKDLEKQEKIAANQKKGLSDTQKKEREAFLKELTEAELSELDNKLKLAKFKADEWRKKELKDLESNIKSGSILKNEEAGLKLRIESGYQAKINKATDDFNKEQKSKKETHERELREIAKNSLETEFNKLEDLIKGTESRTDISDSNKIQKIKEALQKEADLYKEYGKKGVHTEFDSSDKAKFNTKATELNNKALKIELDFNREKAKIIQESNQKIGAGEDKYKADEQAKLIEKGQKALAYEQALEAQVLADENVFTQDKIDLLQERLDREISRYGQYSTEVLATEKQLYDMQLQLAREAQQKNIDMGRSEDQIKENNLNEQLALGQKSVSYEKALHDDILSDSKVSNQDKLEILKEDLENIKSIHGEKSEQYVKAARDVKNMEELIRNELISGIQTAVNSVDSLGQAFSGMSDESSQAIGKTIGEVAKLSNTAVNLFKSLSSGNPAEMIAGALSFVVDVAKGAIESYDYIEKDAKKLREATLEADKAILQSGIETTDKKLQLADMEHDERLRVINEIREKEKTSDKVYSKEVLKLTVETENTKNKIRQDAADKALDIQKNLLSSQISLTDSFEDKMQLNQLNYLSDLTNALKESEGDLKKFFDLIAAATNKNIKAENELKFSRDEKNQKLEFDMGKAILEGRKDSLDKSLALLKFETDNELKTLDNKHKYGLIEEWEYNRTRETIVKNSKNKEVDIHTSFSDQIQRLNESNYDAIVDVKTKESKAIIDSLKSRIKTEIELEKEKQEKLKDLELSRELDAQGKAKRLSAFNVAVASSNKNAKFFRPSAKTFNDGTVSNPGSGNETQRTKVSNQFDLGEIGIEAYYKKRSELGLEKFLFYKKKADKELNAGKKSDYLAQAVAGEKEFYEFIFDKDKEKIENDKIAQKAKSEQALQDLSVEEKKLKEITDKLDLQFKDVNGNFRKDFVTNFRQALDDINPDISRLGTALYDTLQKTKKTFDDNQREFNKLTGNSNTSPSGTSSNNSSNNFTPGDISRNPGESEESFIARAKMNSALQSKSTLSPQQMTSSPQVPAMPQEYYPSALNNGVGTAFSIGNSTPFSEREKVFADLVKASGLDENYLKYDKSRNYNSFTLEQLKAKGKEMQIQGYENMGISNGPKSGHMELLHGREGVINEEGADNLAFIIKQAKNPTYNLSDKFMERRISEISAGQKLINNNSSSSFVNAATYNINFYGVEMSKTGSIQTAVKSAINDMHNDSMNKKSNYSL